MTNDQINAKINQLLSEVYGAMTEASDANDYDRCDEIFRIAIKLREALPVNLFKKG